MVALINDLLTYLLTYLLILVQLVSGVFTAYSAMASSTYYSSDIDGQPTMLNPPQNLNPIQTRTHHAMGSNVM